MRISSQKYRYLLFYKPYGVLSQFTNSNGENQKRTLKDYIPIPDVYPVGRLDWDSEGLMLLTDCGQLQYRLSHPQFQHPRTYWAQVERVPDVDALKQLQQGVMIENYRTRPAKVRLLDFELAADAPSHGAALADTQLPPRDQPIRFRKNVPTAWLEITLTEGKNRQVRRMTAKVGFPTLRLVRTKIAHLSLEKLQPGQWRDLTFDELNLLLQLTRLKQP